MKNKLNKIAGIIMSCAIIILLQACEKDDGNVNKPDPAEPPKEYKIFKKHSLKEFSHEQENNNFANTVSTCKRSICSL